MFPEMTNIQTARVLGAFLRYADAKGSIEGAAQKALFQELGALFSNSNELDSHLYELNASRVIWFEEIGEDGFAPIVMTGATEQTATHLSALLEQVNNDIGGLNDDIKALNRRLAEILTFDPQQLKREIESAATELQKARGAVAASDMLESLLRPIAEIDRHLAQVGSVAERYEDVYRNIIRPVQLEGQAGVRATVRWAIIGIIGSTVLSLLIGNWKGLLNFLRSLG